MTLPTILEHCAIKNRRTSQKLLCHREGHGPVAISWDHVPDLTQYQEIAPQAFPSVTTSLRSSQ